MQESCDREAEPRQESITGREDGEMWWVQSMGYYLTFGSNISDVHVAISMDLMVIALSEKNMNVSEMHNNSMFRN